MPMDFSKYPPLSRLVRPGQETSFDEAINHLAKWNIPQKVIIKVALVGSFYKKEDGQFHPTLPAENLSEIMDCIEAGASGIHFNATDQFGNRSGRVEDYRALIEPCREKYGRKFVADCNVLVGNTFEEQLGPVIYGLAETSVLAPFHPRGWVEGAALAMREYGCIPEICVHNSGEVHLAQRLLIDSGLVSKPYYWIILAGGPSTSYRIQTYMPNARAMCEGLVSLVNRIMEIDSDSVIMVCTAGRASIYLTTLAMLLGLHIRVGTEDTHWKFPHRDDTLKSNLEAFEHARDIAELLGRSVATGDEYREMIGLK